MAGDIGPGDVVVCVKLNPVWRTPRGPLLVLGAAYTVEYVVREGESKFNSVAPYDALGVTEIVWSSGGVSFHPGWELDQFAKGHKPGAFPSTVVVDDRERVDA